MTYSCVRAPFTATSKEVIGSVTFAKEGGATYRTKPVVGVFALVQDYTAFTTCGGGFVTVRETTGKKTRMTVEGRGRGYTVEFNEESDSTDEVETVADVEPVAETTFHTYAEAAEVLGCSKGAVSKRAGRGTLNKVTVDGKVGVML